MLHRLSPFLAVLFAVQTSGEITFLHFPSSVKMFNLRDSNETQPKIPQSHLKETLSVFLGFTGKQKDTKHCIAILDPFSMPKALVALVVDGVESLPLSKDENRTRYLLNVDEAEETTWQAIRSRVEERSNDNTLVRINLSDGVDALGQSALGELKLANMKNLKALDLEIEEDRKFVEEVQLLHAIADKASSVEKHDSGTDVYWLVVSMLKPVFDRHGIISAPAKEACALLNNAMECISKAFVNTYDGKVVIAAFTNDASKVRNTRSIFLERQPRDTNDHPRDDEQDRQSNVEDQEEIKNTMTSKSIIVDTTERTGVQDDSWTSSYLNSINKDKINTNTQIGQSEFSGRSKTYTENYPVIFNIMLWFGVIFFFSLLAICIAIADMDPGRDSIIYRMTSNRMKKDN